MASRSKSQQRATKIASDAAMAAGARRVRMEKQIRRRMRRQPSLDNKTAARVLANLQAARDRGEELTDETLDYLAEYNLARLQNSMPPVSSVAQSGSRTPDRGLVSIGAYEMAVIQPERATGNKTLQSGDMVRVNTQGEVVACQQSLAQGIFVGYMNEAYTICRVHFFGDYEPQQNIEVLRMLYHQGILSRDEASSLMDQQQVLLRQNLRRATMYEHVPPSPPGPMSGVAKVVNESGKRRKLLRPPGK